MIAHILLQERFKYFPVTATNKLPDSVLTGEGFSEAILKFVLDIFKRKHGACVAIDDKPEFIAILQTDPNLSSEVSLLRENHRQLNRGSGFLCDF